MKKILFLVVIILMIGTVSFAIGVVDIRNIIVKMPDQDLLDLKDMIQQEINYRGLEGDSTVGTFSPWYDYGLGKILPNPEVYLGHLYVQYGDFDNSDIAFTETIGPMESYDFESYVDFLIECGFSNNATRLNGAFNGENADDVMVAAFLEDGKMCVMCNS